MDIKIQEIKIKIIYFIKKTLKSVFSYKFAKRYFLLTFILILFFMIITFPYDVIIISELKKLENTSDFKTINVNNIDFSFFSSSYIENAHLILKKNDEINLKSTNFSINLLSLLGEEKKIISEIDINNFQYKKKNILLKGKFNLNSDLSLNKFKIPVNGDLTININKFILKGLSITGINVQGMDIGDITIQTININKLLIKTIVNNKILSIKNFKLQSKDLSGKILGKIIFNEKILGKSVLDLTIELDQNSAILDNYKMFLGPLIKDVNDKIRIKVKGTINNPKIVPPGSST